MDDIATTYYTNNYLCVAQYSSHQLISSSSAPSHTPYTHTHAAALATGTRPWATPADTWSTSALQPYPRWGGYGASHHQSLECSLLTPFICALCVRELLHHLHHAEEAHIFMPLGERRNTLYHLLHPPPTHLTISPTQLLDHLLPIVQGFSSPASTRPAPPQVHNPTQTRTSPERPRIPPQ